jgi:hypothetical protein
LTGSITNPKLIEPVQIACGTSVLPDQGQPYPITVSARSGVCLDTAMAEKPDQYESRPGALAIRAAVEAIGPAIDGRPGALDVGADRHVIEVIDQALPGFVDMIGFLLDAFAHDVRPGAAMTDLTLEERGQVLRLLAREEGQDAKDIVDALFVFTYGAMCSEWSGYDRSTGALQPPATWAAAGYHGPVDGVPGYRSGM